MNITLKTGETMEVSEENAERLINDGDAYEYGKVPEKPEIKASEDISEKAVEPKKKKK